MAPSMASLRSPGQRAPMGYAGAILRVDLTHGNVRREAVPESLYRHYLGGSALGLYYLLSECPPEADPLGPDNVLTFAAGPLAGAALPGNSRLALTAKSPLTGLAGDSQVGGYVAAELKFAGLDAVVVTGRSDRPVYLAVREGEARLHDASHLWGHGTLETEEMLRDELGDPKIQVLEIGPAGEAQSPMASIMHLGSRAAGRNGLGAVMGSKGLKAVAVRGETRPVFAHPDRLRDLARRGFKNARELPVMVSLTKDGSAGGLEAINAAGALPTRNYREGWFEQASSITGSATTATCLKDRETCYGCPVRCKRVVEIKDGPFRVDPRYGGAEYESVAALGSYCGVGDLAAVQFANQLCNHYGLDTISTGATVAFAMECFESGILTQRDTGGLDLRFGNAAAMVETVRLIGENRAIGRLLAKGSARAAAALGPEARRFLTECKGQEMPAHMPQWKKSLALVYAVNPFGADHESSEHDPSYEKGGGAQALSRLGQLGLLESPEPGSFGPEKVRLAAVTQRYFGLLDSVPLCHFCFAPWTLYDPEDVAAAVAAATGWDTDLSQLMLVGERRTVMQRAFGAREGAGRERDTLPERCFEPLAGEGPLAGTMIDRDEWERAREEYYRMCGWDPATGNPGAAVYDRLGLTWLRQG